MSPKPGLSIGSILVILTAVVLTGSAVYSIFGTSVSLLHYSGASSASSSLSMIGVDQVIQGGPETYSFVQSLSSQGLKWNRECLCFLNSTSMSWLDQAGISTIGMVPNDPETSCGSGVLQSESSYEASIQNEINSFPSIHNWEFGNEVNGVCANGGWEISPANYFTALVWFYQVLTSTQGHGSDTIQGPTLSIWTGSNSKDNESCYDSATIQWFETFWSQSYDSYTPKSVLTWVSLHVYTDNLPWTDVLSKDGFEGTCASMTVEQMLGAGLNAYYNAEGQSKQIIISESGEPSNTSGGTSRQTAWYQDMVPFYQSLGYIHGVFAYDLYDTQSTLYGLFNSSLQAKPAWSVFGSYFSNNSTSSTSSTDPTSTNASTFSSTTSSMISNASTSAPSSTSSSSSASTTSSPSTFSPRSSIQSTPGTDHTNQGADTLGSTGSGSKVFSSPNSIVGILSVLAPSRNPPAAYGIGTYELVLIGCSLGLVTNFRRGERFGLGRGNSWRW